MYRIVVLNGEIRSLKGDKKKLCIAHASDLRGYNEYKFNGNESSDSYTLHTGEQIMKECEEASQLDSSDCDLKKKLGGTLFLKGLVSHEI